MGGKLGSKSGNRIAVDLDCPEAIALGSGAYQRRQLKGSKKAHYVVVAAIDKLQFYDIPSIGS